MENEYPRIREITPGSTVKTVLLVASSALKQARNGPFWQLELKDATGSIEARIWSPLSQSIRELPAGSLAEIEARAEQYREQIQLSLTAIRLLSDEELEGMDMGLFIPSSRVAPADMLAGLEALCREVLTHKPWRRFALEVLRDEWVRPRLLRAPAARGIHHAWVGGLLEHTLGVCQLCLRFSEQYPELDRQTLFVAALFHDIGKLREFSEELNPDYTDEGRLVGHISLGLDMLAPHLAASGLDASLQMHFKHLVLSHHGLLEHGSPRVPQTAEAFALHYADNLDAKLAQCRSQFAEDDEPGTWSPYQRTLERNIFLPPRTPDSTSAPPAGEQGKRARRRRNETAAVSPAPDSQPELEQCSLL